MRKALVLLSLCVVAWSEPLWINNPTYNGEYIGTVGIAEAHFPKHVQKSVALMRAKAKLSDMQNTDASSDLSVKVDVQESQEGNSSKSKLKSNTVLKVKIKEKYVDEEGTLYLWVISK